MNGLGTTVTADVEGTVARAASLYDRMGRLKGLELARLASERARRPSVVAVFDKTDETARREAAFTECEALNAGLQKELRKADILAIVDAGGKVVSRDLNPQAMYGDDLKALSPAVDRALKGESVKDVWTLQGRMTEVGLAPIRKGDGSIVGGLLVGYVLSAKQAQETAALLDADIAYFHGGKVQASSFVIGGQKEDVAKTQAIHALLFGEEKLAEATLARGTLSETLHRTIDGDKYVVVVAPLGGNVSDATSGFVVLSSVGKALAQAGGVGTKVLALGLIAIVVALGAAAMTSKRFISPLDQIELGVAEIINGNIDYTFKPVGPDFEGLSNGLNVMLARLLGRDEPNEDVVEEEEGAQKWKAEQMVLEEGDGAANEGITQALAQEGDAAYYPRLYNEYLSALRSMGQSTEGLSVPAFMARLRLAEAGLREKWSCRIVRFQLASRGNQLVFRAIRVA
jgi:hypothetical protein